MERLPFEHKFCPYCGAEGTLKVGRIAWIEVYEHDEHLEAVGDAKEMFGSLEVECTSCDTRHFQI